MSLKASVYTKKIQVTSGYCVVPENIHTPRTEGIGNSGEEGGGGGGGSQRPKNLKQCMKLNWNFQRGGGEGGHRANPFRRGGMDIFWSHTLHGIPQESVA